MNFYDKFVKLCNQKGVSPAKAAIEAGFTRAAPTHWKRRASAPTNANLQKIAVYFGVPVSYFNEESEKPMYDFNLQLFSAPNPQLESLIEIFSKLDEVGKAKLLVYASELIVNYESGENPRNG